MNLDETKTSTISDPRMIDTLLPVVYGKTDNRPAWIGKHRPATSVESLKAQAAWAATHYDFYLNFVRDYMEPHGQALDLGCGAGQNTAMLGRYCDLAIGVDSDPDAIEFAIKHNGDIHTTFIAGTFPEYDVAMQYDYIFCVETMEHVPYDKQFDFLDAALGRLTPNGLMFITTPDEETVAPPHIGIWSSEFFPRVLEHLEDRIVRYGHFDNKNPGVGFVRRKSSHHALVLGA